MTEQSRSSLLDGKVCIVAGGGSGIGAAVARGLADHGARVVVNDLGTSVHGEGESHEPVETVARQIREAGGEAVAHFGDVSSFADAEDLLETTLEAHGRLDALVNFAGILRDTPVHDMSPADFDDVVRVHLRGHFALLCHAAAHWRTTAGTTAGATAETTAETTAGDTDSQRSFLGVSSLAALGNVGQVNYSAAKAGVFGLVRSASTELYRHDVRVNTVVPSAYTRMTETVPEEHRPYTREEMPPEKVVPLVAYLVSDEATDVTGNAFYAGGDRIGLISEPRLHRLAVKTGGWTPADVAEELETVAHDVELTNTERFF